MHFKSSTKSSIWPHPFLKGRVEIRPVKFHSLRGNPLGDSDTRPVVVYLPPKYDQSHQKFPLVVALSGFTGTSRGFLNSDPLRLNLIEQADKLISKGLPPFIIAIPDAYTRYGGSQYVNSTATGNYEDLVVDEFIPWVDAEYRTNSRRAVMGKSSGGYGALTLSLKHPKLFDAMACHSGDMNFELCYRHDFPVTAQVLNREKSVQHFLNRILEARKRTSSEFAALNVLAMAACYSPNTTTPLGFDLPFDIQTAALKNDVWKRWLAHDPVFMLERFAKNLRSLKMLFIDCGTQDEFYLHFGARIFTRKLQKLKIKYHYEEFPDGHRSIEYRYSNSLPLLVRALTNRR